MPILNINKFLGINELQDDSLIKNEASKIVNFDVRTGSLVQKKAGLRYTEIPNLPGIKRLIAYNNGTKIHLVASCVINGVNTIKRYDDSTKSWVMVGSGYLSPNFDYVNANHQSKDYLILTNGVDNVLKMDLTGISNLKGAGASGSATTLAPKGKYCTIHKERLWISSDNTIYCSTVNSKGIDIEDFTTPTAPDYEVNQHGAEISMYDGTGGNIVTFATIFDDVVIMKDRGKTFRIYGSSPSNYQKLEVFSSQGAICDRSLQIAGTSAYFINLHGIHVYDGSNVERISLKIDKLWDTIDLTYIGDSVAAFWDNKYILAVRQVGYSYRNLIIELDTETGIFTTTNLGYGIEDFIKYNNDLIYADNSGNIYKYNSGTAMAAEWTGGELQSSEGIIELEDIRIHSSGTGTIQVTVIGDKKTKIKTINTTGESVKVKSITANSKCVKFNLKILSGDVIIKSFSASYEIDSY